MSVDLTRLPDVWTDETLFADDLTAGDVFELGSYTVSTDELTGFAAHWDPQFFHVDRDAADRGLFGGLIASGIHTMAVFQRLSVAGFWERSATIAARGIRDVRFVRPVRPESTLTGRLLVEGVRHRDGRSLVTVRGALATDTGEAVLEMIVDAYLARRPA
ncbi:MAG TPA: MaoC/PaaZ C-terminal domain-containing protein [Nocardioidaceae bacterium]|nr:MaoC/PaaZ C-terminal domain-containing protein [Nocardioidaceae bacterium]